MRFVTKPLRLQGATRTEPSRDVVRKVLMIAALAALVGMTIGFVKPILMAGLFAATLYPFHLKLRSKIRSNEIRAAVLSLGFAIIFLLPVAAVAFLAASAGLRKIKTLPENWMEQIQIESVLQRLEAFVPIERAELMKHLEHAGTAIGRWALAMLQDLVADLPKLAIVNVVILIGVYVFLSQADEALAWIRRLLPFSKEQTDRLFRRVGGLSSSSVLATIASGFVQASIIGVVLLVMKTPGAILITMTAFVFSFIPIIGTAPVALYLIGSAAIAGDWTQMIVFVITTAIVSVSDNIVRPFVLSDAGKLNAFMAFVAAVGALETMGFYGLFLGPVVAGTVFTLVDLVQEARTA